MAPRPLMFTFAVDVVDEGVEAVLDRTSNAGLDGIAVTAAYHASKDLLPHNPRRRVFFHESGVVYFDPDHSLYPRKLRPRKALVTAGDDVVEGVVSAARARGAVSGAWIVFLHNTRLGSACPEAAVEGPFGDTLIHSLCPSNPESREYAVALATDVARRRPDRLYLESLSFLPYAHGWHHERALVEMTWQDQFLLSLCFCPHCTEAITSTGGNARKLRCWVVNALDQRFAAGPEPPGRDEILSPLLTARRRTVASLLDRVVRAVRAASPETRTIVIDDFAPGSRDSGVAAPELSSLFGLDPRDVVAAADAIAVCAYLQRPDDIAALISDYAVTIGSDARPHVILRPCSPDAGSAADLVKNVNAARGAGAADIAYYNYGALPVYAFDWIRGAPFA